MGDSVSITVSALKYIIELQVYVDVIEDMGHLSLHNNIIQQIKLY